MRAARRLRFAPQLVIMVKEPVAGRVKTRLARGAGSVVATAAYRAMLTSLAARLGRDARWRTILAISPDAAIASRMLPACTRRIAQGQGDLGRRMQRIFAALPPGPVIIVGTDIPAISPSDIAHAFQTLGKHNAVIGPSDDGGYWLIGFKRRPSVLKAFANVRWSSTFARADTEANLAGATIAQLRVLDDVDTAHDYARLRPLIGRRVLPSPTGR